MAASGFPPGEWSPLLVGHQWPSESAVAQLGLWQENREQIADSHHYIADLLNAAKTGPLAVQEGITADALVQVFHEGEQRARQTAIKNGVKNQAYGAALGSVNSLRDKLSDISEQGNADIRDIQTSGEPTVVQVMQIVAVIATAQQAANIAAASCAADISDAGQRILEQESNQSFSQFVKANGIDMNQLFRTRDAADLESTVHSMLRSSGSAAGTAGSAGMPSGDDPVASGLPAARVNPIAPGLAAGIVGRGVNPVTASLPASPMGTAGMPSGGSSATPSPVRPVDYVTAPPGRTPPTDTDACRAATARKTGVSRAPPAN